MNIKTTIAIVAAALALGYGVAWYSRAPAIPPGITVEAKPAKEIAREATVPLIIDLVKVYKPEVKAKLKLPKAVVEDASQHVVASSKVRGDEHPHTITTTVNAATGEFATYDRTDPLPWVAINTKTHIGAYYGLKNSEMVIRVQGQQELLQIKAVHVEAVASGDFGAGKPDTFVGIGARASW